MLLRKVVLHPYKRLQLRIQILVRNTIPLLRLTNHGCPPGGFIIHGDLTVFIYPPGQTGTVQVGYSTSGLAPGTYTGNIDVRVDGGPLTKRVTANVTITPENTIVSPTSLTANASSEGCSPPVQTFTVKNSNTCEKYYSVITTDQPWLSAGRVYNTWGLNGVYLPPVKPEPYKLAIPPVDLRRALTLEISMSELMVDR